MIRVLLLLLALLLPGTEDAAGAFICCVVEEGEVNKSAGESLLNTYTEQKKGGLTLLTLQINLDS